MSSAHEMFQAQFHQHPNRDVHYENTEKARRFQSYRTYVQYYHLMLNKALSDGYAFAYRTIIKIALHTGFDFKMMQEQIQFHRLQLRTLEVEIARAQRNAGDDAYIEHLKHHQKIHQWLVYAMQTERMSSAHYRLAPRRQNT